MKIVPILFVVSLAMSLSTFAHAAEDTIALKLMTCQTSWLDWKDNPTLAEPFNKQLKASYRIDDEDGTYKPIGSMTVLAKKVSRVYPNTMGQGLGFAVLVDAKFEAVRGALAKHGMKPIHQQCNIDEYTKSCTFVMGNKKTILLYADAGTKNQQTLVGCSYE